MLSSFIVVCIDIVRVDHLALENQLGGSSLERRILPLSVVMNCLHLGWSPKRSPIHAGVSVRAFIPTWPTLCTSAVSRVPLCFSAALFSVIHFTHQVKAKGEVCRISSGDCDVTEYCNGSSAVCEEDFYVHDGHPCGGEWVCVKGSCKDGKQQCRDLFGYGTFNHMNFLF